MKPGRPWNSESFRDLMCDELVVNPAFLESLRNVTGGMLRGEQKRVIRCIAERVDVGDDPEDLYEGLLHRTGEPRHPR